MKQKVKLCSRLNNPDVITPDRAISIIRREGATEIAADFPKRTLSPKKKFALILVSVAAVIISAVMAPDNFFPSLGIALLFLTLIALVLRMIYRVFYEIANACGCDINPAWLGSLCKNFLSRRRARFGMNALCKTAKKIRRDRKVPPILLKKLEESLLQFPLIEKEYASCRLEAEKELEEYLLIREDLLAVREKETNACDEIIRASCSSLATELDRNLKEREKRLTDAAQVLVSAQERMKESIKLFHDAAATARDFEKYGEISRNILEHQSEVRGLISHETSR